jgi:hypothetical protein
MKIQDPREKELAMGNRPDLFSPMSPDDMMMSAPLAGSELAQQQATVEVLEEQLRQENNHQLKLFQPVEKKRIWYF